MTFLKIGCFLIALLYWSAASSQTPQRVTVGKDCFAFHEENFRNLQLKMEPLVTSDVEIFVELVGLPNIPKINALRLQIRRVLGLKNAAAFEGEGCRTIAYDPDWAAGDTAGFYLALGHETGHHFCGHSIGTVHASRAQKELEADQFGGASIKRFEIYHNRRFFSQVLAAAAAKYPEQDPIYPPRALRLAALKRGYEQGSPCGGLAPVDQSGFSTLGERAVGATPCRPVQTGPTSYVCE